MLPQAPPLATPQMVLLWSTELFPSPEDWQDLEGSVYRLLVVLLRCLATRRLPHFLHPGENLFHGEPLDLASLQQKVEAFAQDPPRFLRFHFGHPASTKGLQADPELRALLRLPDGDRAYWDTAYFDTLLSQVSGGALWASLPLHLGCPWGFSQTGSPFPSLTTHGSAQLQVYGIQDDARRSAMSQLLAKVQREIPTRS